MRDGRWTGWRRTAALMASALVGTAALAVTPVVLGERPGGREDRHLAALEPGYAGHGGAHADTPANLRRERRQLRRCADGEYRMRHRLRCPGARRYTAGTRSLEAEPAATVGRWGAPFPINSYAVHATLLPTGKVLWLSREAGDNGGQAWLWDPATGRERAVPPPPVDYGDGTRRPANLFCSGHALLPDGRLLVAGGNLAYYRGEGPGQGWRGSRWLFTFNPWNETWTRQRADMARGRWYPTVTALPDGTALITGGWDESGDQHANTDVELFTPSRDLDGADGTVAVKAQRPYAQLYPHMFVLPDTTVAGRGGTKVLMAGPAGGPYEANTEILDTATWTWTRGIPDLPTQREWGTAVLMPGGPSGSRQVLLAGGSNMPDDPTATRTTVTFDLDDPRGGFRPGPAMNAGRSHHNTVILPDGSLLSVGGGVGTRGTDGQSIFADPVYAAEILAPGGAWRPVAAQADARTYHSTALLLPDGRVLSAGDDRASHAPASARTAELYSPPYLFAGARPVVEAAPAAARYGVALHVATPRPAQIARAVLVRPGSATHATDMDQRSIELPLTAAPGGVSLRTPAGPSLAPPGWYMLNLVSAEGVPSASHWLRLDPAAPDTPAPPLAGAAPGDAPSAPVTGVLRPAPPATPSVSAAPVAVAPPASAGVPTAGRPASPATPTAPRDTRAPVVRIGSARVRPAGRGREVRAEVRADEPVRALVRLAAGPRRLVRRVSLSAGRPVRVTWRLPVPRAGGPALRIEVLATDAAGNVGRASGVAL